MARHKGWVLIGRIGDDYYFCESVFKHRDDFQGATGSIVRPVSPEEYEWASDRENVAERLSGCYEGNVDSPEFEDWVDSIIQYDGAESVMFDESYGSEASESFEALGIKHECTDCIGCGRIFGNFGGKGRMEFDEVFNCKALVAIEALEDGAVSADYAAKVVFNKG